MLSDAYWTMQRLSCFSLFMHFVRRAVDRARSKAGSSIAARIAMMAILLRLKWLFFLLFSAFFTFLHFHEKTLNTQIQNVTFCMIAG